MDTEESFSFCYRLKKTENIWHQRRGAGLRLRGVDVFCNALSQALCSLLTSFSVACGIDVHPDIVRLKAGYFSLRMKERILGIIVKEIISHRE